MNTPSRDAGIPVLTEIIDPLVMDAAPAVEPAPRPAEPVKKRNAEISEAEATVNWKDEEWYRLERKIRERILRQVMGRIDAVLEQHVRDRLADVLQNAVQGLATEIKTGLQQSLEEVVSRAVSQEITRLQTTKK